MAGKFSYGYLKEAVRAHLDLEEEELEVMNITSKFHIFANEAVQQICHTKPKYGYFQFTTVAAFTPLVHADGLLRVATIEEQNWVAYGLPEPTFASTDEIAEWYNKQAIYLVGQVITMPDDFLAFAIKKAFVWTDSIANKITVTKEHISYLSNNELVAYYAATYLIPYQGIWVTFAMDDSENDLINMPSDLLLTIPIYVASVCLQQRNMTMAQAKRQEFEIAVSRCKSINLLETISITPSFK
jgi:hypothetical protein